MKNVIMGIVVAIYTISGVSAQQWVTSGANIYNSNTGNVGIGTPAPKAKLDVNGNVSIGTSKLLTLNPDYLGTGELPPGAYIGTNGPNSLSFAPAANLRSVGAKVVFGYASYAWLSAIEYTNVGSGYTNLLLLKSGGNVLIGKTSQTNTSYKLDVNGNARMNKVVVNTTGADFVFDSSYQRLPLDSLHAFIKKYHHLPDIPSADVMQKEGLDVGDNQMKLLQKIEELTLIVIEQNKRIEELEKKCKSEIGGSAMAAIIKSKLSTQFII